MKHQPRSAGALPMISFDIPDDWTPEQALAVFEMLDELRERIWAQYKLALQELIAEQRQSSSARTAADDMSSF